MKYAISFDAAAEEHLRALRKFDGNRIRNAILIRLSDEPVEKTRHRKSTRPGSLYRWQLSVGEWRVFYDVVEEPFPVVKVQAVGQKVGNRLFIAGEEVTL